MHTNNILVPGKFGFGRDTSTEEVAFRLTENMLKLIHQKMHVGGIF
jgi:hypothetical protein